MHSSMIDIKTSAGFCDTFVAYPEHSSQLPLVIFYMDAVGLRPQIFKMVETIAAQGYYVLAPNIFYRSRRAPIVDYDVLLKPENVAQLFKEVLAFAGQLKPEMARQDAETLLAYAQEQPQVDATRVGTVGYCMGGGLAIRLAALAGERVKVLASFHGGRLATDAAESPHLLAPQIKAELYLAHADQDQSMPPEQMERLRVALDAAGVRYRAELYEGARHGFTMADLTVYDEGAAVRHWRELLGLLERGLKVE